MSNFKMEVTNPDQVEMRLAVTMTLKEWKALRETMSNNWPAWDFKNQIDNMIRQADKHFYPQEQQP